MKKRKYAEQPSETINGWQVLLNYQYDTLFDLIPTPEISIESVGHFFLMELGGRSQSFKLLVKYKDYLKTQQWQRLHA
ncbi:hypothetical protein SBOR_1872 [Sclerotinia borealis F-4128]|uniref:Uncharacterized protein n=1 Tax=Sclerotinia borealis (strain F-4128) TaxID=1432307 RepID=W9CLS8_SCLBF|nr:hypothetical protein SBOR_1872 [Sclerotinia borealis F-4128]